eukprot:GILJ01004876.1.p1 GENE.GILJ01004876.1~~GILJ01004876.1.p1  ORF type:complete len:453 (+),score=31.26 GILJ01004876.1:1316-2674(+)
MTSVELVSEVENDLLCPICLHLFREPVELNECEHVFCRTCLEGALGGGVCPICQDSITEKSVRRAHRFVINRVDAVQVRCTNGCGIAISFGRLKTHVDTECEQRLILCPDGCGSRVKVSDVTSHRESCPFRKEVCDIVDGGCGVVLLAKDLNEHHCLSSIRLTLAEMALARETSDRELRDAFAKFDASHADKLKSLEESILVLTQCCKTYEERIEQHLTATANQQRAVESEMHVIRSRLLLMEESSRLRSPIMNLRPFGQEDRSTIDTAWVLSRIDQPNSILFEAIQDIFLNPEQPDNWNLLITVEPQVQDFARPGNHEDRNRLMLNCVGPHACVNYRGYVFDGRHWVSQSPEQLLALLTGLFKSISVLVDSLAKRALDVSLVAKYNKLRDSLVGLQESQGSHTVTSEILLNVIKAFTTWNYSRLLLHEIMTLEARTMLDVETILGPEPEAD